jgi:hypothetical protein
MEGLVMLAIGIFGIILHQLQAQNISVESLHDPAMPPSSSLPITTFETCINAMIETNVPNKAALQTYVKLLSAQETFMSTFVTKYTREASERTKDENYDALVAFIRLSSKYDDLVLQLIPRVTDALMEGITRIPECNEIIINHLKTKAVFDSSINAFVIQKMEEFDNKFIYSHYSGNIYTIEENSQEEEEEQY